MRIEFLSLGSLFGKNTDNDSSECHQTSLPAGQGCADDSFHFEFNLCVRVSVRHSTSGGGRETDPKIKQIDSICSFLYQFTLRKKKGKQPSLTRGSDFSTLLINFLQIFSPGPTI